MKLSRMTLDEHRDAGAALAMIHNECAAADRLNQFKKGSRTSRTLLRIEKNIDRLRSRLETVSLTHYGDAAWPSLYFVNPPQREGHAAEVLRTHLRHRVGEIINGKVPVPIVDLYLRCDRSLQRLDTHVRSGNEHCG